MGNLSTRPATAFYSPDRSKSHFHHGSSTKVETLDKEMWIPVVKKTKKSKGKKKNSKKFMTMTKTPSNLTPHHSGMYNAKKDCHSTWNNVHKEANPTSHKEKQEEKP